MLAADTLRAGRLESAAVGLAAAFAGWALLSAAWSPSAAQPVQFTERTLVYVVALAAAVLVARNGGSLVAGVAAGAAAVCAYGLATRLAPGTITSYPPPDGYQLEEPIGYWNGVAILAAMGAVAAFCVAAEMRGRVERLLAAAALPVLVTALYLTFSRGGMLAFLGALGVAVAVSTRRLHLLAMLALLAPAAVVTAVFASRFAALTSADARLANARSAGWRVAVVLVAATAASAAVGWALPLVERRVQVGERTRRRIGATLAGLVALAAVAGVAHLGGPAGIAHRVSSSFSRSLPDAGGDLNRRFTSLSSDGRADYWDVAWREIRAHPVLGGGAGSYERWWHQYRPTAYEAQNAHNLYLETLAELGPVGLALLAGLLVLPFAAAVRARGRPAAVAGIAAFSAFVLHAALDWDFQIPAVTVAALVCAAAVLVEARPAAAVRELSPRLRGALLAVLAPLVVAAIAVQVGNGSAAGASAALDRGDAADAHRLAARADAWMPWSYEPLQLRGEAELALGDEAAARASFAGALERDRTNWRLWLDLAQATSGTRRAAAITRVGELNPRR